MATGMSRRRHRSARSRGGVRRSRRAGTIRRRLILGTAALTIPVGLLFSVRRTSDGTRLAEALGELRREESLLQEQLSYEIMRVDSLSSLQRITAAAAGLGLREADDDEIIHVADVAESPSSSGGGP